MSGIFYVYRDGEVVRRLPKIVVGPLHVIVDGRQFEIQDPEARIVSGRLLFIARLLVTVDLMAARRRHWLKGEYHADQYQGIHPGEDGGGSCHV